MLFSTTNILSALALLTFTSAAPTMKQQSANYPPLSKSRNFKLVAKVASGNLAVNNFVVQSYHVDATNSYAVLAENKPGANPRVFYVNGTAAEVQSGTSSTITNAGNGITAFPEALVITPSDPATSPSGRSVVQITPGAGQPHVGLNASPEPIRQLHGYQGQTFYACSTTLPYGTVFQLFYRGYNQKTPDGCSDVSLLPQCSEGSGAAEKYYQYAATVDCYADVAGIDLSHYSA